jgi:hypothetical protein
VDASRKEKNMDDKRKKELKASLDQAIKFCGGTLEMDILVRTEEEATYMKSLMKGRKKVKNLGVEVDKTC